MSERIKSEQELALEAQLRQAQELVEDYKRECQMFADAWQRELGGQLVPKTHMIDSLVITTRWMREERDRLRETLRDCLGAIQCGHKASIGSINNTYIPQISVASVERWLEVLNRDEALDSTLQV